MLKAVGRNLVVKEAANHRSQRCGDNTERTSLILFGLISGAKVIYWPDCPRKLPQGVFSFMER